MKKLNWFFFATVFFTQTSPAYGLKTVNEIGLGGVAVQASVQGTSGIYQSSTYDKNGSVKGTAFYYSTTPWSIGESGSIHLYLMQSIKAPDNIVNANLFDAGIEFRKNFPDWYLGGMIGWLPSNPRFKHWPVTDGYRTSGGSSLPIGFSLGYQFTPRFSLRFSTLHIQESAEFSIDGVSQHETATHSSTRAFLMVVYHFREKRE